MRRVRVLVADDHPALREALVELLDVLGFEVVAAAADGVDAVAMANELGPDVVVMDLSMPVLNGLDATRLLREDLPELPVVVLSAHDSAELKREALAAGAVAYLVKDCSTQRLQATLERALTLAAGRAGAG